MDFAGIAAVITALAGFSGVFMAFVNSKMKRAEERQRMELARFEKETNERDKRNSARLSTIYSSIYGYLWKMLFKVNADRIGILQPHPLNNKRFFSASFEILRPDSGIASYKANFQCMRMSEWPAFVSRLSNDDWLIYTDVETIRDRKVYTEAHRRGVKAIFYRRMTDIDGNWIGTLYCEFISSINDPAVLAHIKGDMDKKATLIQDILPEYHPPILTDTLNK